jgi:VanZ family protein
MTSLQRLFSQFSVDPSGARSRFSARWLAVAIWMALIFGLSAQPQLPTLPEPLLDLLLKKAGHFSAYAVLAALLWRALVPSRRVWATAWLLAVVYALSDEWHQSFVPGRHPSLWDVLVDGCGAVTALLIIWFSLKK